MLFCRFSNSSLHARSGPSAYMPRGHIGILGGSPAQVKPRRNNPLEADSSQSQSVSRSRNRGELELNCPRGQPHYARAENTPFSAIC